MSRWKHNKEKKPNKHSFNLSALSKRLLCFLTTIVLVSCILRVDNAQAKALTSQITVYTQNNYTSSKWNLAGGSGRNLKTAGCVLFAWAHSIEMLSDTKRGDDLLTELIGV